jgi:hypothetical protein
MFAAFRDRVRCEVRLVGPPDASAWLERNENNRALGGATVDRYASYMARGRWRLNGEPVILSSSGRLLDGQHRLAAVVKSGLHVPMVVLSGLEDDAFKTLNQGKTRSGADTLFTLGQDKARVLSSALTWLHRYETNSMLGARVVRLSNGEVADLLEEFPAVVTSVRATHARCVGGFHPPGPVAFLHFVCWERHPDTVAGFFERVLEKVGLEKGMPEFALVQRIDSMRSSASRRSKADVVEWMALFIKAWNASLLGRSISLLRWHPKTEGFPEIL